MRVRHADLQSDRKLLPLYSADGTPLGKSVHRENLDFTGEQRAQNAKKDAENPMMQVIGSKDGKAFKTAAAATRELNRRSLQASHEVVSAREHGHAADGFVVARKRADSDGAAPDTVMNGVHGQISEEQAQRAGITAGPIRLTQRGLDHINRPARLKELQAAGYADARALVDDVTKRFNAIYRGKGDSLLLAIKRPGEKVPLIYVELKPGEGGYEVESGFVSRPSYLKNDRLLWEGAHALHSGEETPSAVSGQGNQSRDEHSTAKVGKVDKPALSAAARDAAGMRVKTPAGEIDGKTHVDGLVRDGYTRVESVRQGDKLGHVMVNEAGEKQPIKTRQLKYAKEATAKAAVSPKDGSFGPVLTTFHHDAKGAIAHLMQQKTGEAVGALHHPEVGDIDLVYGKAPDAKDEGFGLAKIAAKHPEVLNDLQGFLDRMRKVPEKSGVNRIRLESPDGHAIIRLDWDGSSKNWLLSAFEKKAGADTRTDTVSAKEVDDTARHPAGLEPKSTTMPDREVPQETPPAGGVSASAEENSDAPPSASHERTLTEQPGKLADQVEQMDAGSNKPEADVAKPALDVPQSGVERAPGQNRNAPQAGFGSDDTKQDPNSNVQLFRRGTDSADQTATDAHTAKVDALAKELTSGWKGDDVPDVKVVPTAEDLPSGMKLGRDGRPDPTYRNARGAYDGKTIWVVADRHDVSTPEGRAQLASTVAHEGIGHYGIERIVTRELGADAWKQLRDNLLAREADGKGGKDLQSVLADVRKRYGRDVDPETFAKESLAVMAERGLRNGLLDRAVAAVRSWLRKFMPNMRLRDVDLRQLLAKSDEYLRRGETPQERVHARAALAFSKDAAANRKVTTTPEFKSFFGDWQAMAAQKRLSNLKPTDIRVPDAWRGLPLPELRNRVREALQTLAASGEALHHPEIGDVAMTRNASVDKPISSSRDPAKLYVLGDLRRAFEGSIYASEKPPVGNEPNVAAYEKLLGRVNIDGHPLAVVFTVRRMRDGRQFYNAVTLEHEKTPAVSPRDTPASGEHATSAHTGVGDFVRQQLKGVNSDDVSKVVDETGQPLPVFHGTADDFNVFGHDRAGEATGHATSPLGHFFTPDRAQAEGYARNASDGRPADERVVDAYLSIKKPYTMSLEQAQRIESPGVARAVRAQLEAKGYDGIHLPEQNAWVAFHPEQIKSASENRGTFDRENPNIYFDKSANVDDSGKPDNPRERRPFSHASDSIEAIHENLPKLDDSAWQKVKDYAHGKWIDLKPFMLGALQLRHVLELAESTPELKDYAKEYANHVQAMDADRNKMQVDGAEKVSNLTGWAYEKGLVGWRGKLKAEARRLFRFLHEATQSGVDPAEAYERLKMRDGTGQMVPWTYTRPAVFMSMHVSANRNC